MFANMLIMPLYSLLCFQLMLSDVSANTTSKNLTFGTYHTMVGLNGRRSAAYHIYDCVPNRPSSHFGISCYSGPASFLVLLAAGHAVDQRAHHGASTGPGRDPWGVLWALKSANSGK